MTDPISGLAPTPVSEALAAARTPAVSRGDQSLGQDAFLKLLVAQLRYQDPTNPAEGTEFLSQTASFTQVEKLEEIARATSEMLAAQSVLGASGLVGRTVTWTDTDGSEASGVVTAARFGADGPVLRVGDTDLPVGSVKEVRASAAA